MSRKLLPLLRLLALSVAISPSLAHAQQDRIKVVTTFTVIADMARNVAGEAAQVVSITKPGAEIHGYEPTPRDIVGASDADLILWNGFGLERWFEQFLSNMSDVPSATLTDGIAPISISGGEYDGKPNPHSWMSVDNAIVYIDNIESALAGVDPENAAVFAANARDYKARLLAEIAPLSDRITALPETSRWLVSCEGAFSYLARDLGLQELYLWPINADQQGTPQQVRAVIDGVRKHAIPTVFCESTVNTAPAEQVARETGARYGGVLYVDSLSAEDGPVPTYVDLLRVTTETIADGLAEASN